METEGHTESDLPMIGKSVTDRMKLRPMDFSILAELEDGRNVAANIYIDLDASRQYINERLTLLEDWGLVDRIGPNPSAGLYEINALGRAALKYQSQWRVDGVDFEALIREHAEE